ncbi:MAG TPA: alpha/beta hydrolase [Pseudonocardiaceae bacterium]
MTTMPEITLATVGDTDVRGYDQGRGPVVLIVGPGLDDGTHTAKLAEILAPRFRVLRLHRRQYRLDLKATGASCSVAQEVEDVLAVAHKAGPSVILYGHSSGGVVALEALAAAATETPALFVGAVIFEPAIVIGPPLGDRVVERARGEISAGKPRRAMAMFLDEVVGLPPWQARLAGAATSLIPRYGRLVPSQVDDLEALNDLGVRLGAYAGITVPTVLLGGDRSPAHLATRLDALEKVLPHAQRVVLHGRDHAADATAPREVARVIQTLADRVPHA